MSNSVLPIFIYEIKIFYNQLLIYIYIKLYICISYMYVWQ